MQFSKVKFMHISSGMRDMILEPNTFGKKSVKADFLIILVMVNIFCLVPNNSKCDISANSLENNKKHEN